MSRKETNQKIANDESDVESDVDVDGDIDVDPDVDLDIDDQDPDDGDALDAEDDDDTARGVYIKKHVSQTPKPRSEVTLVPAEKRVTSECMTLYEYAMVIGTRATHISEGAPLYTDATGISNARDIAIKELDEKKCPLSISRKVGNKLEVWEVNEMTKPML